MLLLQKLPLKLFRLPATGFLLEWSIVATIVTFYVLIGLEFGLWDKLACATKGGCAIGLGFWILFYAIYLVGALVNRFTDFVLSPDALVILSLSNIAYHLVRWPILFASSLDSDLVVYGFWADWIVAGFVVICFSCFACWYKLCTVSARELRNQDLDALPMTKQ